MPNLFPIQSVAVPLFWPNYFTFNPPQFQTISTSTLVDRITSLGANDVRIIPTLGVLSNFSDSSYDPPEQQSLESLRTFTDAVKARGLSITWMPITTVTGVIGGDPTQVSHPDPSNPSAWFASFREKILDQARIAQTLGAARFSMFTDIEQFIFGAHPELTTPMLALIAEVKSVFSGQITCLAYSSTGSIDTVPLPILKALDLIGVGLVAQLTTKTDPTLAELQAAFHSDIHGVDVIANLAQLAADAGRPLWLADFAPSSYDGAIRNSPSKFDPNANFTVDTNEQVLAYQAYFNELAKFGYPFLQGISAQNINRIENDNGLLPKYVASAVGENFFGKPAQQVLTNYFTGATPAPTLTLIGTKYGEALQGGYGPSSLTASAATAIVNGGPAADTITSSAAGQSAAQELRLKVTGVQVGGLFPSFAIKVNGAFIPVNFTVQTALGGAAATLSIPIFETGKINSVEVVETNWFFGGAGAGLNRFLRVEQISLNGATLSNAGATYTNQAGEVKAFGGDTNQGGAVLYNTSAVATATPLTVSMVGNLEIDGGPGRDKVVYAGTSAAYAITQVAGGWTVVKPGGGVDHLKNVEVLQFADKTLSLSAPVLPASVEAAFANILREPSANEKAAGVALTIDAGLSSGALTTAQAIAEVMKAAGATTSVATLSYQFFTGKIPSLGGIDYLVSPTGPNPNNLNSAYFQSFNLENRYINFAVNLGSAGEGKAAFSAGYGALSLFEATRKAYLEIFGAAPSDTKLHALLDPTITLGGQTFTRADYFAYYGGDGPNGQGTKAAMVGFLLAEAVKADVGVYARSSDAFLADLADGATFAVDLVGVYGKPDYVFQPG